MTDRDRIADLEARLAIQSKALKAAEVFLDYIYQMIPLSEERTKECIDIGVRIEQAMLFAKPAVATFLARVKRQGAAEELRRLLTQLSPDGLPCQSKYPYELTHVIEKRAVELEGE